MDINEGLKTIGKLHIVLKGENGVIKEERFVDNLVVTTGKAFLANAIKTVTGYVFGHMAVGIDNTAPAVDQTTLVSELAGGRVAITSNTVVSNVDTIVASFPAGVGTGALQECGLFNQLAVGGSVMLSRAVFGVINKGVSDSVAITWIITVG